MVHTHTENCASNENDRFACLVQRQEMATMRISLWLQTDFVVECAKIDTTKDIPYSKDRRRKKY